MYNVTSAAKQAWSELFAWVSQTSGVELKVIEHPAPAPLEELWYRADLGCAFMCGWPFSLAAPKPALIAAPIPSGDRYEGKPIYFTDMVVRRDKNYSRLEDTFGARIAWTVEGSHSGFNAPRHHLLPFRSPDRPNLYRQSNGPVITPRGALESILDGVSDVAPLDSFALDLIRRHEPESITDIEIISSTLSAPFPPLVANQDIDPKSLARLQHSFLVAKECLEVRDILNVLGLAGFSNIEATDYDIILSRDREALAANYYRPG